MEFESSTLNKIKNSEEVFWKNPGQLPTHIANEETEFNMDDIKDAAARLERFASFIRKAFPETEPQEGIIESGLSEVDEMKKWLDQSRGENLPGTLMIKRDDLLPISGTIKARGAIYEVLKHAEDLALEHGLLKSIEEDYSVLATEKAHDFFSKYSIAVGTTGNLGISVGTMGRKLGFKVTVHMSVEARQWKKTYLRNIGVEVIEHKTNFSKAVEEGRRLTKQDPNGYFVDDEHSKELFFGYTVGGYRMKRQLEEYGITVNEENPLFVYLPCGIGGSPSGVAFGMKQAFGEHVHCFFAEPTKMPCMLAGLETGKYDGLSVEELGLGGLTVADGLAVPRPSAVVSKVISSYFSGGYTLQDERFSEMQWMLYEKESIFLEPAAVAGLAGPYGLLTSSAGQEYIEENGLSDKLAQATHIAWGTGGSMVPEEDKQAFLEDARKVTKTVEKTFS